MRFSDRAINEEIEAANKKNGLVFGTYCSVKIMSVCLFLSLGFLSVLDRYFCSEGIFFFIRFACSPHFLKIALCQLHKTWVVC